LTKGDCIPSRTEQIAASVVQRTRHATLPWLVPSFLIHLDGGAYGRRHDTTGGCAHNRSCDMELPSTSFLGRGWWSSHTSCCDSRKSWLIFEGRRCCKHETCTMWELLTFFTYLHHICSPFPSTNDGLLSPTLCGVVHVRSSFATLKS